MNSEKKGAAIGKALLSGPYLIWMAGFTLIPLAMILWYGLTDKGGGLTMANVIAIASADHAKALWLSLGLSLVSTVLCLLLAYPLAMILRGRGAAAGGFIVFIFILPMWMNFLLRTLAWQTLLEKNGVINGILNWLHLPSQSMINTPSAIVLGMVYNFLPFMVLPIYNVLSKIDDNIINAADDAQNMVSLKHSGHHQRHHHGVCPFPDHLRYFRFAGRQQDSAHRQCHRTGIYQGQQLASGKRTFTGPHGLYPNQYGHDSQIR